MWYAEQRLVRGEGMRILSNTDDRETTCQGPERIKGAYAWRRYLECARLIFLSLHANTDNNIFFSHGGRIALGSDFPVESIDPLKGFYAAVSRRSEDGKSPMGPGGW